ncbi:MAG: T9SS type A sorting domain-containing protein [Bacteroidales bacterium]
MKNIYTLCLLLSFIIFEQSQANCIAPIITNLLKKGNIENRFNYQLLNKNDQQTLNDSRSKHSPKKQFTEPENIKVNTICLNRAPNTNAPITTAGSVSACPNDSFNIPITVTNFTNVGAITLRLDYDTNLLRFNKYSNVNASLVSALTINSFMDSLSIRKIVIVWYTYPTGINLANGSKLIDLNFSIKSGSPTLFFNNVVDGGGKCEYADALGNAYTDSPTSTYYINPVITNLGAGVPGTISGSTSVCRNQNNVTYNVPSVSNASSYIWTLPVGASGSSTSNSIIVNYGSSAISGNITVKGYNAGCGNGIASTLPITVNITPVAAGNISGSSSVCPGQNNVNYTVPAITNATSYVWTYSGTGATINGTTNSVSINFSTIVTPGNLTVKGNNLCGDGVISASYPITINPLPSVAGSISGTNTVCQGQNNVSFSVPAITNATSYIWSYSGIGATINGTSNNITINFAANATSGNLNVKGNNSCGDGSISINYPITINPLPNPSASITGTNSVCQGQNTVIYSIPSISNATSYIWTYSGTAATINGTSNNITINYATNATAGNLTVKGHNACGDGAISAIYSVNVNPLPNSAGIITGTATVCKGDNGISYTVPSINNTNSYVWNYSGTGATIVGSSNNIIINFSSNATSGNLTVKGNNSCGDGIISANYAITVNPLPSAAGSISGAEIICQGSSNVAYTVPAIANAISYVWNYSGSGATILGTSNNITINFSSNATSGNLTVKANNTCGDGSISANFPITINAYPEASGSISGISNVCQGQNNVSFSVPDITNASSYGWNYSGTGATISGTSKNVTINFSANATSGNLTVKGINACGDGLLSSNFSIIVNPLPSAAGSITGSTSVCQNENSVFYEVASIANATSYIWDYTGSSATINGSSNSIAINFADNATSGNLTIKGSNSCGVGTSFLLPITVNPLPEAAGSISGFTTVFQGQSSVNYTTPIINNATSYIWTLPGGASGTSSSNSLNVDYGTSAVSGVISIYGQNSCGNGLTSTLPITVLCTPPSTQASNFTILNFSNSSMKLGWTRGNGNAVLIIARQGNAVNTDPINGVNYTADSIFGNGSEIGTGNFVVFNGTATSVEISGLSPETTYYYAVYEYNTSSTCFTTPELTGSGSTSSVNSTFTAFVSNSWENTANWNHGIPSYETNAIIPANKLAIISSNNPACNNLTIAPQGKLTINNGNQLLINGTLTIQSNASGSGSLIHNNVLSGTIERYIPINASDEFHMISSPVSSQQINSGFIPENQSFFTWDESTSSWISYENTSFFSINGSNNLIPSKGYAVSYPATSTKNFSGVLNHGNYSANLSFTAGSFSGWNLIGNPYPSSINWDAANGWTRDLLEDAGGAQNAIWIWNPEIANYGAYISNSNTGTNGVTSNISMGQGFWVKATSAGTISMTNEVREHSLQSFLKTTTSSSSEVLRLKVTSSSNTFSDEIIIRFGNPDNLGGAEKIFSLNSKAPNLYSTKLNKNLSINLLTDIAENSFIPVGFKAGEDANYIISAIGVHAFGTIMLEDLKTGIQHNLKTNSNYLFSASTNDLQNRFVLHFSPCGINETTSKSPVIYYNNHNLNIYNPWDNNTIVNIYDANGRLIESFTANKGNGNYNFKSSKGVYIIKLINNKDIFVKKQIVY